MKRMMAGVAFAAAAFGASASAQPGPTLTAGRLQSLSPTQMTVVSQGRPIVFRISPKVQVISSHPGSVADIRPGSFIGTTNTPTGAAAGSSTEVHVFPPGVKLGEGDRPMSPAPGAHMASGERMTNGAVRMSARGGARMTNGSIGRVAGNAGGLAFDVDYGNGVRHIVVPAKTPVMVMSNDSVRALKPGMSVLVGSEPGPGGSMVATFINLPPPRS